MEIQIPYKDLLIQPLQCWPKKRNQKPFAFHVSLAFGNSGGTRTSSTLSAADQALELLASGAPDQITHHLYFHMDRQGSQLKGPPRPPQPRRKTLPSPLPSPSLNRPWTINCGSSRPQGRPHARSIFLLAAHGFPTWEKNGISEGSLTFLTALGNWRKYVPSQSSLLCSRKKRSWGRRRIMLMRSTPVTF